MTTMLNIVANTAQAEAALDRIILRYKQFGGGVEAASNVADTSIRVLTGAFLGLGAGAFVAYNAVSKFNEALTHVKALGQLTDAQMMELAGTINQVAAEFGYSGDVIAEGAVILSKAGLSVEEINESMRAMTMLSKANAIAFEEAAEITVFAIESFDMAYSQVPELLDKIQVATQASILDIGDLQKAFAYAGSTANMTGISLEQLISMMAVLSNRALEAGISSRSMNKMFLDILDSADQMQDWVEAMGFGFQVIDDGKLNIDALIESFGNQGVSIELLMESTDIFTVRALRAWGLLLGAADDYEQMLGLVNSSSGVLEAQALVQMESFTAQFAKLKEEFLALFRTPEAMEAVGEMVENIVDLFQELKPQLVNAFIEATEAFARLVSEGGLRSLFEMLFEILSNVVPVLANLVEFLGAGEGALIKFGIALKMASFFIGRYNGLLMDGANLNEVWMHSSAMQELQLEKLRNQLWLNGLAQANIRKEMSMTRKETDFLTGAIRDNENAIALLNLQIDRHKLQMEIATQQANVSALVYQKFFAILNFGTNVLMSAASAGIMLAMSADGMMRNFGVLLTVIQAVNVAMAVYTAFQGAKYAGPAAAFAFVGYLALVGAAMSAFRSEQKAAVADTGMFVGGTARSVYDEGGIVGPRHRLVYVEPGEQIISKTQGMVGMGGANVTVNIGEIYAEDGTDFADKLAEALPNALRRTSYSGGF